MPEMQEEIYCHPQHRRARCWEGEMSKMWREKTGTTDYRVPGKNFEKELVYKPNFECQSLLHPLPLPIGEGGKGEGGYPMTNSFWVLDFGISYIISLPSRYQNVRASSEPTNSTGDSCLRQGKVRETPSRIVRSHPERFFQPTNHFESFLRQRP